MPVLRLRALRFVVLGLVTRAEVLRRMRRGDLPTRGGGYSSKLFFSDGARCSGLVARRLVREGRIEPPSGSHCDAVYTLRDADDGEKAQ